MFVILPILWLVAWGVVAGLVAAFSGLSPHGGGLMLFLAILLGGGIGLPVGGGIIWMAARRIRNR